MQFIYASLLSLFFISCGTTAQQGSTQTRDYFILIKDIRTMDADHLGNIYLLDGTQRLFKFDTTGRQLFSVVNNNLGEVHSIDAGNPFKVLAFYRDQQTIVLYDRTLSEIQRISLAAWGLSDVTAVNLSPDNAIWAFDGTKNILVKLDPNGKEILTSDPFDIIRPPSRRPDRIADVDHFLLVKETGYPAGLFDDFGEFLRPVEVIGDHFSVHRQFILHMEGAQLMRVDMTGKEEPAYHEFGTEGGLQNIYFSGNRYYSFDHKGVFLIEPRS